MSSTRTHPEQSATVDLLRKANSIVSWAAARPAPPPLVREPCVSALCSACAGRAAYPRLVLELAAAATRIPFCEVPGEGLDALSAAAANLAQSLLATGSGYMAVSGGCEELTRAVEALDLAKEAGKLYVDWQLWIFSGTRPAHSSEGP